MAGTAAHLVEAVIPRVPMRQWVLALPKRLRPALRADPTLATCVLRVLHCAYSLCGIMAMGASLPENGGGDGRLDAGVVDLLPGDAQLDALIHWLYPELRRLAQNVMAGERAAHTLQTTSLVNEAYLRLADTNLHVASRGHFLALCARVMRRVLIDHARGRERLKRGGPRQQVTLGDAHLIGQGPDLDMLALDQALTRLNAIDARRARLIEGQLFSGMSYPEMAEANTISEATVDRELRLARAFLQREMSGDCPA